MVPVDVDGQAKENDPAQALQFFEPKALYMYKPAPYCGNPGKDKTL